MQTWVHTPQAVAERMHAAQTFLKRHRALHGCAHHVQACVAVLAVVGGAFDVRPATCQAVQCNAVSRRIERRSHEGFHAVRNGVHASGGRQGRGQTKGELGVEQRCLGHQMPRVKTQLAPIVHDENGPTGHLAARASGGGHGNDGRHGGRDFGRAAFDGGVGFERTTVGRQNGHAFGAVDG